MAKPRLAVSLHASHCDRQARLSAWIKTASLGFAIGLQEAFYPHMSSWRGRSRRSIAFPDTLRQVNHLALKPSLQIFPKAAT